MTPDVKVREWYVCYDYRPPEQHWTFRYMKPNFRHVELLRAIPYGPAESDVGWLAFAPRVEMLEVDLLVNVGHPNTRFPVVQKVTVVRPYWKIRSRFSFGPPTCVEAVKWALGISAFFVRTPWQLCQYIAARGGVV